LIVRDATPKALTDQRVGGGGDPDPFFSVVAYPLPVQLPLGEQLRQIPPAPRSAATAEVSKAVLASPAFLEQLAHVQRGL
jgi:hypothetical protein